MVVSSLMCDQTVHVVCILQFVSGEKCCNCELWQHNTHPHTTSINSVDIYSTLTIPWCTTIPFFDILCTWPAEFQPERAISGNHFILHLLLYMAKK